jgi:hypothetical protein
LSYFKFILQNINRVDRVINSNVMDLRATAFEAGNCRCRVWGRNQASGAPGATGTQCKRRAGSDGMCGQHRDPDKRHFGFYDEPRPTLWGISHDGRLAPVPKDRKRGTTIPWRNNILQPQEPQQHHRPSIGCAPSLIRGNTPPEHHSRSTL